MIIADPSRLTDILSRFSEQVIMVVGDLILDRFIWGKVERISPEAPVPIVEVLKETVHLGGAANVATNLVVLEARPLLIGVVGEDYAGKTLLGQLDEKGISRRAVMVDQNRVTSTKTRIIARHQQVCRTDSESKRPVAPEILGSLQEAFTESLISAKGVVLSDYAKGILRPPLIGDLIGRSRQAKKSVTIDPKSGDFSIYRNASVITPNQKEAERASGIAIVNGASLIRAGKLLLDSTSADHLLITRGEEGMTLFSNDQYWHVPTAAHEVFDVTGAGDTVIATLSLALAAGASPIEAALLANHAAGVVVGKLGTATATVQEIETSLRQQETASNRWSAP